MMNSIKSANLISVGTALPKQVLNNQQLEKFLNLTDHWIIENIGVKERKIVTGNENAFYLATLAANQAIKNAKYENKDLDLVVVATATSEYQFPGISCLIKDYLGIENGYALDIAGECGGFISALNVANNAIRSKQSKSALVIGVDTLTKVISWEDPISTLFGDGAGAVILEANTNNEVANSNNHLQILDLILKSTCKYNNLLSLVNSNISPQMPKIIVEEEKFIKTASKLLEELILEVLKKHNLQIQDINWMVPQQVHIKILNNLVKKFNINRENLIITIEEHGNIGAGSIPLALEHGLKSGLLKSKDQILLLEVSSGLTTGAALIKYN